MTSLADHMRTMAAYNAWANERLYAAAASLPDDAYRQAAGAFFGSLHGTLNHLLVTDRLWLRRLTGEGDAPDRLDVILFERLDALRQARVAEDARLETYVAGLSPDALTAHVDYATTSGVPQRQPRSEALAHLFNHQTHHRGQAHAILTRLGVAEPPSLDLLLMQRELARRATASAQ
ncbi:DinB family protein [Methylobacterium sp. NEAU 140]|uniref:DinB family protein n=1 Tax=Methylobacterium sp. NEAU 140 TaxID=3064945 RepID=UPI002735ADCF|nr:DinB family protein [Methylobacterium sp. NEAU 140]MDP4021979.1 DinB family protein [Methylobacterium sp. NEAU 140]